MIYLPASLSSGGWSHVFTAMEAGYSVWYGVLWSGSAQTELVSGGDVSQTTISGLEPSMIYSIEVAAVNSAGVGLYSAPTN